MTLAIVLSFLIIFLAFYYLREPFIQTAPSLPILSESTESSDSWIRLYADFDFKNPVYAVDGRHSEKIIMSERIRSIDIRGNQADLWMCDAFSPINNIYNMTEGQLRANGVMKLIARATPADHLKMNLSEDVRHFYLLANRSYPELVHRPEYTP